MNNNSMENRIFKNILVNNKTFTIDFHSGIGNSIGGFFYGLYIYNLLNLSKTHIFIVLSTLSNRGFYSITDFFETNDKMIFYKNKDNINLFEDNKVELDCKSILDEGANYYDLKTIFFKINPIPDKYYDNLNIMSKIKSMCHHFDIRLKSNIKNNVNQLTKNFIGKTYGLHWRSTDSKHNHRELNVSKDSIGTFKIKKVNDLVVFNDEPPIRWQNVKILYNNKYYIAKIVTVSDNECYQIIFDTEENNLLNSFKYQNRKFVLDLAKFDIKYLNATDRIKRFLSFDSLFSKLTKLSNTIKLIGINKNIYVEKILKLDKDYNKGDSVEIFKDNKKLTADIISINKSNLENISFNVVYHDNEMLSTIEKNDSLEQTILNEINEDIINGEYENIFICSDDLNMENKLYEKYSKKYKCFVYNKKNQVTKVPGLEKYPWYIDNKLKEEIIKKTNNNELPIEGGPCNNGVLMGIPYNSYQNIDQLIEALIDTLILSRCNNINKSSSKSTFPTLGKIIRNLQLIDL